MTWQDWERRARRRRIRDAIILWTLAIFATIGVWAVIVFLTVTLS